MPAFKLGARTVGHDTPPLVIAEIGINHEGSLAKAKQMVDDAAAAGCEVAKFQCHVVEDEMIPNDVKPGHVDETIWDIMSRCALSESEDRELKAYVESKGMIYLSTPFSRAAADRLEALDVVGYKIGSGECNNYPLIRHVAGFGKPMIISTGMNDIASIRPAVDIIEGAGLAVAITHCTSMYPTPYDRVRLGALAELQREFPNAVIGLSDHSIGNYTCFAAVALGARILEKHFTSDKSWPGPDVALSMDPPELADLVTGSRAIFESLGGSKTILPEEQPTINFAYACVVATRDIAEGEAFANDNLWVKRPGTGEIKARDFEKVVGQRAARAIPKHAQIRWADLK
jgi:sialic acid synthase SpsE